MSDLEPPESERDAHLANEVGTYEIDPARSAATFAVKYVAGRVTGSFKRMKGSLQFNPAELDATEAQIIVDARSVDTGNAERDQYLQSSGFLAVEQYPEILFTSTEARLVDGNVFELSGKLTMHGITNPVMLQVTYLGMATAQDGRKQAVFDARAHVSRKEFEMSLNQMVEVGGFLVSDRIDLTFDIHATKSAMPTQ